MSDPDRPEWPIPLPFLGVLRVEGPDAVAFLQGQVTNDMRLLADGRTLLAACSTPQGRTASLLRLRQRGDTVHALLPAELAEPTVVRLRRFVLRAKLRLSIADDVEAVGFAAPGDRPGPGAEAGLWFDYAPGRRVLVRPRQLAGHPPDHAASEAAPGDIARSWSLLDIAAGLPQVFAATAEAFVPQMLNLDLLDAISFTKGCYTGQEIIARTQNLGRIKRRTFRYRLADGPRPSPLSGLHRSGIKVAEVLMSAQHEAGIELLAVTNLDARDVPLTLDDGRVAEPVAMAYTVPT